jgi:hypothetical protein
MPSDATRFQWQPQPAAWTWLLEQLDRLCEANQFLNALRDELQSRTGTRLVDWLDYVALDEHEVPASQLTQLGFSIGPQEAFQHEKGLFPPIIRPESGSVVDAPGVGLKVESVAEFLKARQLESAKLVSGDQSNTLRVAEVNREGAWSIRVVERHGNAGWMAPTFHNDERDMWDRAQEWFADRARPRVATQADFADVQKQFSQIADVLGRDTACDRFFASERAYWQQRNRAAQVQYRRQQSLGMGWANHDHHTYRCSREHFAPLVMTLEQMGFVCRERFYAGAEAGWGAQVLEQPVCGIVIFADVDLSPGEVAGDFAHQGLSPRQELGTVGLWCKLHGEAFFAAGMHHLECQFDFDAARQQLSAEGIESMAPFTDFPFLRQAFTEAEVWHVPSEHLRQLVEDGWITPSQAEQFTEHGARGSHLEILERNDGYKGFNQTGISEIIARTDPRRQ